ncbi:unnamed protein product [Zymoseptoria tritici ST99CH_1A5]|uniref:Uncharacterized protein n=1 Tax=Zymoseptoria tritici ST99CH_1A5 TaxID=1276529 RepID=A0A1Y6M1G3_ZYMTR|nr:unnamed protein product [Zymoseptoria tritici ST99CH_3D1]SMY28771.1 unnamed protein product [Zymoseptoria tritici ST99CH_1A5]
MAPIIPNEIWQKIIAFTALDATTPNAWLSAWLPLRQTSRSFRSNTAQAYLQTFLAQRKRCMFFQSVDTTDKARVVFGQLKTSRGWVQRDLLSDAAREEWKPVVWKRKMENYLEGRIEQTPYVGSIYGVSTDSELPGLRCNFEQREISFEWEGMLDAFIAERLELGRLHAVSDQSDTPSGDERSELSQALVRMDEEAISRIFEQLSDPCQKDRRLARKRTHNVRDVRIGRLERTFAAWGGLDCTRLDVYFEEQQAERVLAAEEVGTGSDEWVVTDDEKEEM